MQPEHRRDTPRKARTQLAGPLSSILPPKAHLGEGNACSKDGINTSACWWGCSRPRRTETLIPTLLALAFPEHADTPARRARMLYSHHSGTAARNNSQLLPKGIFSCIIYLNTCLRFQGRVRSLSSREREGGAALGDLDHFHWKIREWRHRHNGARLGLC